MAHPMMLTPGSIFAADFRIERPLAEGGMGAVYVAEQLSTGQRRALKVMQPQLVPDERSRERFLEEARIGSRIESEHVVQVVAAGVDAASGVPWLAMELLEGVDLDRYVRKRGPLPPAEALELLEQIAHALADAHAKGIIHRDLKPENLFAARTRRRGAELTVKILDFGIARTIAESRAAATVTSPIGSPLWMAPEQAQAGAKLRPSADVWALGLIAFYLLTGKSYWRSANHADFNLSALLVEVMTQPLEAPSLRAMQLGARAALPDGFDAFFARCVCRDADARFPDAGVAIAELRAALSGAPATTPGFAQATAPLPSSHTPAAFGSPPGSPPFAPAYGAWPPASFPSAPRSGTGLILALAIGGAVLVAGTVGALVFAMTIGGDAPEPPAVSQPLDPTPVLAPVVATPAATDPAPSAGDAIADGADEAAPIEQAGPVPTRVRAGTTEVQGSLSRQAIQRVVSRHQGEIRSCYERRLLERPTLEGRVTVSFVISPAGSVQSAEIGSSTMDDPTLETCITAAVRRWVFPAPDGGGVVAVSYPFVLSRAAPAQADPPPTPATAGSSPSAADREQARRCVAMGDNRCAIRLLAGRAREQSDLELLIEAYRATGEVARAVPVMRTYVERFPDAPRSRNYRQIIARHGG